MTKTDLLDGVWWFCGISFDVWVLLIVCGYDKRHKAFGVRDLIGFLLRDVTFLGHSLDSEVIVVPTW